MTPEEQAAKEYAEAGVDLPELTPTEEPSTEETPEEEKAPEAPTEEPKDEPETLQEPKERVARKLSDKYKEVKTDLRTERELREQAERERDEYAEKLKGLTDAKTPEEKQDASDEIEAFAKEINADPATLRRMRELFIKETPGLSEEDRKAIEEIRAFKAQTQQAQERQLFEQELSKVTPVLKEYFPNVSDSELDTIKKELDRISHTKEWHDKDLEYIAFKHKETLSAFVSPKKRGMESKGRIDVETPSYEFDPNADLSNMSETEMEQWQTHYQSLTRNSGIATGRDGKKLLI